MTRVAIVGGGIAGLAIAHALKQRRGANGGERGIVVLERSDRAGGNVRTERLSGYLCEWGPNGFLDNVPETLHLVRALGLAGDLQRSDDAARKRFIFRGGRLHRLPEGPGPFLASGLLSWPGKLRIALEPFARKRPDGDETIHEFASRRIGREAADVLIDSMVSGIFAGDSRRLSLRACFPKMWQMETDHGSLFRAMLALRKRKKSGAGLETLAPVRDAAPSGPLPSAPGESKGPESPHGSAAGAGECPGGSRRGDSAPFAATAGRGERPGAKTRTEPDGAFGAPSGTLTSFQQGTETLIRGLLADLGAIVRTRAHVVEIGRAAGMGAGASPGERGGEGRYVLTLEGGETLEADAIVLAGPSAHSARLLEPLEPRAAAELRQIESAPVLVVCLGYDGSSLPRPLDGFGFLVPRGEGPRILGCLWDSSIYPGRAPEGKALVRAMIGGAHDPAAIGLSDEEAAGIARSDLHRTMGLDAAPELVEVFRHPLGIPQYTPGHLSRLRAIEDALARHPGICLAGNSYRGISMNACIAEAGPIADRVLATAVELTGSVGSVLS